MNILALFRQAKQSKTGLLKLNVLLGFAIPFNRPHRIKIQTITDHQVITKMPYRRRNFNHIKGIHACGLATCSEFASGSLLLSRLDPKQYRLIMASINMTYHYQAKSAVQCQANLTDDFLNNNIILPLQSASKISIEHIVETYDTAGNHICSATITWQIKSWDQVKTAR